MKGIGVCQFCGQVVAIDYPEQIQTDEEFNQYATEHCNCIEASKERERKTQIRKAKQRIRDLFLDGAERCGFEPVQDERIITLLDTAVYLLAYESIKALTVHLPGYQKAKLSVSVKGKINIEREKTAKYKFEE